MVLAGLNDSLDELLTELQDEHIAYADMGPSVPFKGDWPFGEKAAQPEAVGIREDDREENDSKEDVGDQAMMMLMMMLSAFSYQKLRKKSCG